MGTKISAIIITKNEEKNIKDCLKSVSWADEVLMADSGSTDNTVKFANKLGARILEIKDVGSFANRRNQAAKAAKNEWLFYVDADERCTPELKREILKRIQTDEFTSYDIPRKNLIFGKWFRHGGQWPDKVLRLMKKEALIVWHGKLHEQPKIKGKMGSLKAHMIHKKSSDLSAMVDKTNDWSEIEARLMYKAGHPKMNIIRFTTAMFREFWLRFVRQLAFMDGTKGIIYGLYQVYSRFISYAKLWEMQIQK